MSADNIFNVLASIMTIALVTVILGSPNTARVIRAAGSSFTTALQTAMTPRG